MTTLTIAQSTGTKGNNKTFIPSSRSIYPPISRVLAPDCKTVVWEQPRKSPPYEEPPYSLIFQSMRERGLI